MTAEWFDLAGKSALVTGGSKGLGRTIALALARAGADVAVASRTRSELQDVADEIRSIGRRSCVAVADMADEASIEQMVANTIADLGQIDILVNNAGIEGLGATS